MNRITSISKDEISMIDKKKEKFIIAGYNKIKSKVMIDHVKSLRELHIASDVLIFHNLKIIYTCIC